MLSRVILNHLILGISNQIKKCLFSKTKVKLSGVKAEKL